MIKQPSAIIIITIVNLVITSIIIVSTIGNVILIICVLWLKRWSLCVDDIPN